MFEGTSKKERDPQISHQPLLCVTHFEGSSQASDIT